MKLLITGDNLKVEILEGQLTIDDVKNKLKNLSKEQIEEVTVRENISTASPHSSKSNMQGKLNAKPKMPI